MKHTWYLIILIVFTASAFAQGRGMGTWPYDVKTETTVSGTVQAVQEHPGRGAGTGTHLLLKTKDSTLDVHVAPTWFLEKEGMKFAAGDIVEVTGSMIKTQDGILARVIKRNDKSITVRNSTGVPVWAPQRQKRS